MRRALLILSAVALVLVPTHAQAGSESVPTTFKLVTGSFQDSSDPLTDIESSDDTYVGLLSAGHDNVVKFDLGFTAVPNPATMIGGKVEAHITDACTAKLALYAWNKKRWVTLGATFGEGTSDDTFIRQTDRFSRFLRTGKVTMRVTCTGPSAYQLSVDFVRVLSS